MIGCSCNVCLSSDVKNKRRRSSIMLTREDTGEHVVVDTSPDFRMQMLDAGVTRLSKILYTHTHADHLHGFDDLRAFCFFQKQPLQCYLAASHQADLKSRFAYAFQQTSYEGVVPQTQLIEITQEPFELWPGFWVEPSFLPHGGTFSTAFRFGSFLYATDFKSVPENVFRRWQGKVDTMVASGIHFTPHSSHSTIPETLEIFDRLQVKKGILTHTSHKVDYQPTQDRLPPHRYLAYDGMSFLVSLSSAAP